MLGTKNERQGNHMTPSTIRAEVIASGLAAENEVQGCTEAEVYEIERRLGRSLPLAYRHFLLAIGRRAGSFMRGSEMFYNQVSELDEAA